MLLLVRLAFATGVVLWPGAVAARALGCRGVSGTLAWSLTFVFGALTVTFLAGGGLTLTLVLLLAAGSVAWLAGRGRAPSAARAPVWLPVALAGALLGLLLWHVAGAIGGDGLFHLARVRKLGSLHDLSLHHVDEFPDGGLHPGYAFPLWHAFLALVTKVAGVDPARTVLHEATVLTPLAVLAWYEAGWALFRRRSASVASAGAAVALGAMASGHGGSFTSLALPATVSQRLLAPAALALALEVVRAPSRGRVVTLAAGGLALVAVHPTYALFIVVPLCGFLLVRWLWARSDVRSGVLAVAALVLPAGAFGLWLLPTVRDTRSVGPGKGECLRGLHQYATFLDARSCDHFRLAPEVLARSGAVAVAALVLVPVACLAARRRWSAFVVGGTLAIGAAVLVPALFVPFSDAVSLSQSRRLAGFIPFAFALAGGLGVAARLLGRLVLPAALGAGIALQLVYSGDFGYALDGKSPAWPAWIAVGGGLVALLAGLATARRAELERSAGLAAALFLAPVFVHGFANWSPSTARPPSPLTTGLISALRTVVPSGATVYSDPETSYRIAAYAPVYICVAPPGHVGDTKQNRPRERVQEFRRFAATGDLAIPRACGATWLVVDRSRFRRPGEAAPPVYRDARYELSRIGQADAASSSASSR
jgi:hypothetical protein